MKPSWLAAESPQRKGRNALEYDLVSAVTHLGHNSSSGHYIAHVKQPSGKWLRFDDQDVTVIPLARVLEEPAYLLIYQLA
jgi:ubiquitin carboxyl-terminal hydrolase 10